MLGVAPCERVGHAVAAQMADDDFKPENLEFGSGGFKDYQDPQLAKSHIKNSTKKTEEYKEQQTMRTCQWPKHVTFRQEQSTVELTGY